ncbi:hypothetical protein [Mariniflexile maritimum]|uniref:hypothetical protein n=1 Tax=Mariniflexile maritimum TaxID=2682493 RepID=UPI0012F69477|nr:hypothetical protein [Mariniflexile maritimum]
MHRQKYLYYAPRQLLCISIAKIKRFNRHQGGRAGKALEAAAVVDEHQEWVRIANAQLRYYLHIQDPDSLSDTQWAQHIKELHWIRKAENSKYN